MFELEKIICFHFFHGDKDYMPIIRNQVNQLVRAGYNDDFIYDWFDDNLGENIDLNREMELLGGAYD